MRWLRWMRRRCDVMCGGVTATNIIPARARYGSGSRQNTRIVGFECIHQSPSATGLSTSFTIHSLCTLHSAAATSLTFFVCCSCSLLILDATDGRRRTTEVKIEEL